MQRLTFNSLLSGVHRLCCAWAFLSDRDAASPVMELRLFDFVLPQGCRRSRRPKPIVHQADLAVSDIEPENDSNDWEILSAVPSIRRWDSTTDSDTEKWENQSDDSQQ